MSFLIDRIKVLQKILLLALGQMLSRKDLQYWHRAATEESQPFPPC